MLNSEWSVSDNNLINFVLSSPQPLWVFEQQNEKEAKHSCGRLMTCYD